MLFFYDYAQHLYYFLVATFACLSFWLCQELCISTLNYSLNQCAGCCRPWVIIYSQIQADSPSFYLMSFENSPLSCIMCWRALPWHPLLRSNLGKLSSLQFCYFMWFKEVRIFFKKVQNSFFLLGVFLNGRRPLNQRLHLRGGR